MYIRQWHGMIVCVCGILCMVMRGDHAHVRRTEQQIQVQMLSVVQAKIYDVIYSYPYGNAAHYMPEKLEKLPNIRIFQCIQKTHLTSEHFRRDAFIAMTDKQHIISGNGHIVNMMFMYYIV